jgi:hypothetical protein
LLPTDRLRRRLNGMPFGEGEDNRGTYESVQKADLS